LSPRKTSGRRVEPSAPTHHAGGATGSSTEYKAGGQAPTSAYRFAKIPPSTRAIEYTDAWGMYRAQMADYGVKVRFGGGLCRRGERVENYLHRKFYRQQEAPTVEGQAWEWAAKLWREEKERPPTVEEQARERALKGRYEGTA